MTALVPKFAAAAARDGEPISFMLSRGLDLTESLAARLQALDDVMLSGRPDEIAGAAFAVEQALRDASPTFRAIATEVERLGARNLQMAAHKLRDSEQGAAAGLADALRLSLGRFAKRSAAANRRAQQLNRGLNTALRSLQALGVEDNGRLIAEA